MSHPAPFHTYPDDIACSITIPLTPRNPYGIRICRYAPHPDASRLEREIFLSLFALEVTVKGTKVISGRDRLQLGAGMAATVSPGPYRILESPDYESIILFFNDKFPCDFIQQNFKTVPAPDARTECAVDLGKSGLSWFVSSIDTVLREPKYFPCMTRALLQDACLRALSACPDPIKGFFATAALRDNGGLETVMAAHSTENISNERLARLCGKSVSAFHRHFAEAYGTTPQKWLMERRLERARTLLALTSMTITQICHETGFKDSAHFSRAFRKRFGASPSESIRRQKKGSHRQAHNSY